MARTQRAGRKARLRAGQILDILEETYPDAHCELDFTTPFELLIATILSAQTTDARVNIVTPRLFSRAKGPQDVLTLGLEAVEDAIRDVGLFRAKARNIMATCDMLVERHAGEVPNDRVALEALPGVGPKTASVVLSNAFGVPALAVDTHVFRVSHRLGLSRAGTADATADDLMALWPAGRWIRAHHTLIFHGRRTCVARRPLCETCPVARLCPEGRKRLGSASSSSQSG